jgi:hypothetical protein
VTNVIPLASTFLPVHTVNSVQTLKAYEVLLGGYAWDVPREYDQGYRNFISPERSKLAPWVRCAFSTVLYTLEDAIEFHAFAPLEALASVWPMAFISGVDTVNCFQTLKDALSEGLLRFFEHVFHTDPKQRATVGRLLVCSMDSVGFGS